MKEPDVKLVNGKLVAKNAGLAASIIGIDRGTYYDWRQRGCPGKKGKWWPVTEALAWYRENSGATIGDGDDAMMCGHNSPALEEYRRAKAKLAALEVSERESSMFRAAEVEKNLGRVKQMFRDLLEQTKLAPSPDFQELLIETLEDLERVIQDAFPTLTVD